MKRLRGLWRPEWLGPGAVAVGLAGYAGLLPSVWMKAATAPYRMDAAQVRPAPVAIVLGAGIWGDRPSPFLAGRLDVALRLYREGKVKVILVSGDNSRREYDEPTVMWRYLVERGVPGEKVVRDYAGFDTWDSCVRAKRIFGVDRAIVVSQVFHLPRAVALCRAAGVRAVGVGHDSMRTQAATTGYGYLREGLASFKALVDVARKPRPRFLGPQEPGVRNALQGP
ncbi:SanA/YdcF family protein [Thermomonospora catenispora]|uniref:SanA/YdcF family protein n=1 Tax=Thermomonospora catenispora TaxID=2493090 RepID=UPI00111DC30F|nr:ElyC/SanA/YdcF family protein [Thermomonospora catenispora]TNY38207.1 hypothetical protein EIO00_04135 [Thermomonospora catenispora]